jgi:hypothetical protein
MKPRELESGDLHVVVPFAHGVLVAVVDGLGHGAEAAVAARTAAATLQHHAADPLTTLVQRCHTDLRKTRGAVLSVASFDAESQLMTWLGVGNVEGVLFRADPGARPPRESLLLRGGVVGYQLPTLRPAVLPIFPNDTLIFATDGISGAFSSDPPRRTPQDAADGIVARFAKETDDALALVARYVGRAT